MSKNSHSIPTTAMLNAEAASEENVVAETPETETFTITFRKKMIKKALIAVVASAALTYVATRLTGTSEDEDSTESSED